jgi:hypothetical protein
MAKERKLEGEALHAAVLLALSAVMVAFCAFIIIFRRDDMSKWLPWLFVGWSFMAAYEAYSMKKPSRWVWSITWLLTGLTFLAQAYANFDPSSVVPVLVCLFVLSFGFEVNYVWKRLAPNKSEDKKNQ